MLLLTPSKFCRTTPSQISPWLKSAYVLNISFCLTYKVLTTFQAACLWVDLCSASWPHLFFVCRHHRSISLILLAQNHKTNRSFRYASPSLWNQLPASFRQPRHNHSSSYSSQSTHLGSPVPSSPLLSASEALHYSAMCVLLLLLLLPTITPTQLHSKLKPHLSTPQIFSHPPTGLPSRTRDCSTVFSIFFARCVTTCQFFNHT